MVIKASLAIVFATMVVTGAVCEAARYVIIRSSDGYVANAVEWDGNLTTWQPPAGHTARLEPTRGHIGDTFDGVNFIPPATIPPVEDKATVLVDILATKTFGLAGTPILTPTELNRLNQAQ